MEIKQQEIVENNKLIAEFMGLEKADCDISLYIVGMTGYPANKLNYHQSWDWLMPVVEKIERCVVIDFGRDPVVCDFEISYCSVFDRTHVQIIPGYQGTFDYINTVDKVKINATYTACVEFIKWYNEQNN